jgi:hypothetical protein
MSPLCKALLAASSACLHARIAAAAAAAIAACLALLPLGYVLPDAVSQLLRCEVLPCGGSSTATTNR